MGPRHHRASFPGCRRIAWTLLFGVCLGAMPAVADEIYRWTDANGNVHFGNRKPAGAVADVEAAQGGTLNQAGASPATAAGPPAAQQADDPTARLRRLQRINKQSRRSSSKPILFGGGGLAQSRSAPSESSCQASYGKSCDELENWREKAVEDCERKGSAHCDDPSWIDRHAPKTLEEQRVLQEERRENARARYNRAQRRNR